MMTLVIGAALTWLPLSDVPFSAGVAWMGYVPWFDKDASAERCEHLLQVPEGVFQ